MHGDSYFFGFYSTEHVVLESLDAAKEPEFAWREPPLGFEFRRQQTQCADQIGHLEQLVVTWFNGLRKFDDRNLEFFKPLVQKVRYVCLPAIVIDF